MPATLAIHEEDDDEEKDALSSARFQQWLWEGRHDCPIALATLRLFGELGNRGNASVADFFVQLWEDYADGLGDARPVEDAPMLLPVVFLAHRLYELGAVPFDVSSLSTDEVHAQLIEQIWEEVHSVEAFVTAWTGSTVLPKPEERTLGDHIVEDCTVAVAPWPTIERDPTSPYEDGRFVKAFPLEFPMGQGDLRQARLRDDFSVMAWAQHKSRFIGMAASLLLRAVIVSRGLSSTQPSSKRAALADRRSSMFPAPWLLRKRDLRELIASREDLIRDMAHFGAEIPTTPMSLEAPDGTQLEWIVRQMSWQPPWLSADRHGEAGASAAYPAAVPA